MNGRGDAAEINQTPAAAFLALARQEPDAPAVRFLQSDGSSVGLTRGELLQRAIAFAARLREEISPGGVVALLLPTGPEFVCAFYGCFFAGAAALPLPPLSRAGENRLSALLARARPDAAVILERADPSRLGGLVGAILPFPRPDLLAGARDREAEGRLPAPQAIAYLQFSSGTTSTPKMVALTHGQVFANASAIASAMEAGPKDRHLSWLPLYHDMGLVGGVISPLLIGCETVLMSPSAFTREPLSWLGAVSRFRATISGAPDFAFRICAERAAQAREMGLDLEGWDLAYVGAETVRPTTLRRFAHAFGPCGFRPAAFFPCYGLAETVLMASGGRRGGGWRSLSVPNAFSGSPPCEIACCGSSLRGHRLAITDPQTRTELPEGVEGEILLQGPSLAAGYWNPGSRRAEDFSARLPGHPALRWLPTGDRGFLRDGELYVTGRNSCRLVLRGRTLSAESLEATVETAHPALRGRQGAAFSVDREQEECLVLVHEVPRRLRREPAEAQSAVSAVRRALADRWGVSPFDVLLVPPGVVPRTTSGKAVRDDCRRAYLSGELERWRPPEPPGEKGAKTAKDLPASEGERLLAGLWEKHLGCGTVGRNDDFLYLGGDSLAAAGIAGNALRLGLRLEPEDFLHTTRLADQAALAEAMRNRGGEESAGGVPAKFPVRPRSSAPEGREYLPLTPHQLWFLDQPHTREDAWRVTAVLETPADLDSGMLQEAWAILLRRHEALRLSFPVSGGERQACIAAAAELPSLEEEPAAEASGTAEADGHLDTICLAGGPVAAARYRPGGPGHPGRLLITIHHLACDEPSLHILGNDLREIYSDLASGGCGDLPGPSAGYSEWVHSVVDRWKDPGLAQELPFWQARAARPEELLPVAPEGEAEKKEALLRLDPVASWALLQRSPKVYGRRAETVLLAALSLAMEKWTGRPDRSCYVQRHGRFDPGRQADFSSTVGWLSHKVPVRLSRPASADPFAAVQWMAEEMDRVPRDGRGYAFLATPASAYIGARLDIPVSSDIRFHFLGARERLPDFGGGWVVRSCFPESFPLPQKGERIQVRAFVQSGRVCILWRQNGIPKEGGPPCLLDALRALLAPLLLD